MTEPAQLRISDADRHQVAELLRDAAGEGRLEPDELDERLEATYGAKVYADLVPILADLPGEAPRPGGLVMPPPAPSPVSFAKGPGGPVPFAPHHPTSVAVMSGVVRKGVWEVGDSHSVFTLMGGAEIDLREARFGAPEVVIQANTIMGGIDITVNAWTNVVVDGIGIMGGFEQSRDKVDPELDASSPTVRVKGVAFMGGVTVTRKPMPGEKKRKRLKG
ncbi:DUF1707 domain-containing protein [Nocardioides zeae]|uniref:DUF1707 domain-containing protein n=1 Tax=Nocardioides imazamoxiresistens TaxID=3231893 RepID=A0ABU3PZB0_9ACTN|nr:DUF1707 domain-containing protein [Nocardioides zeae]MDT9594454.1 DUF1707 domain-containing protein [Nocardioides zeae]